jgi:hypothetical protein
MFSVIVNHRGLFHLLYGICTLPKNIKGQMDRHQKIEFRKIRDWELINTIHQANLNIVFLALYSGSLTGMAGSLLRHVFQ